MAPSRLAKKRTSKPIHKKPAAPAGGSNRKKYKDIIVTTLITLLITGLFGDFVIKRNIQGYNREREAFDGAAKEGDKAFSEARDFYNSRLKERRSEAQKIIKYIKDNDIAAFSAAYPAYARTVAAWNDDHDAMAKVIIGATECDVRFAEADEAERKAVFAPIFEGQMDLFRSIQFSGAAPFLDEHPDRPEKAQAKFLTENRFCPTFFLTRNQPYSVHRRFTRIHRKIYNYLVHNHSECRLRHIQNLPAYYRSCAGRIGLQSVEGCTQRYDALVSAGSFCSNFAFDLEEYKVRDIEFNELDFYWGLGDRFFKTFRRDYILRECQSRLGFWGALFRWDCDAAVTAYLGKT